MTIRTIGEHLCSTFSAITISALLSVLGLVPLTGDAIAQQRTLNEQLVGSWTLVSVVNIRPDGTKFDPTNGKAAGLLMFDSSSHFSSQNIRLDIPKLASNNRQVGTPEEFKAVAQGVLSYFGTYSLDVAGTVLTQHVESSSFSNYNGTNRIWSVAITGDELTLASQAAASGGANELKWNRVK